MLLIEQSQLLSNQLSSIIAVLSSQPAAGVLLRPVLFVAACSWKFPRAAIRPLCEKHGKILPEHVDFLEKIAFRYFQG